MNSKEIFKIFNINHSEYDVAFIVESYFKQLEKAISNAYSVYKNKKNHVSLPKHNGLCIIGSSAENIEYSYLLFSTNCIKALNEFELYRNETFYVYKCSNLFEAKKYKYYKLVSAEVFVNKNKVAHIPEHLLIWNLNKNFTSNNLNEWLHFLCRLPLFSITNAVRLIHRGEIENADFSFEAWGDYYLAYFYDNTPVDKAEAIVNDIIKLMSFKGGVIRYNGVNPHSNGLVSQLKIIGELPKYFEVHENNLNYKVTLTESAHVGLFLDHRDTRFLLRGYARNKRCANLFSYTCSFSTSLLYGGASQVVSVDIGRPCLQTGLENVCLNNLNNNAIFIQEDARVWLKKELSKNNRYDIIVCDPPVFATTQKGKKFSIEKEWEDLVKSCKELLTINGMLMISNNHRNGKSSYYYSLVRKYFNNVNELPAAVDFPDSQHVRIYLCING